MCKNSAYRRYDDGKGLRDFNVFDGAVDKCREDTQMTINLSYTTIMPVWISNGVLRYIGAASYTAIM